MLAILMRDTAQPQADPPTFHCERDPHRVASRDPLYLRASAYACKHIMARVAPSGPCVFPLSL